MSRAGQPVRPPRTSGEELVLEDIAWLGGRVRDAIVLTQASGDPWIATASRDGDIALIRHGGDRLSREVLLHQPMGFGRLALLGGARTVPVLYATRDDGVVVRLEGPSREASPEWRIETIYAGPQGPRGVASGRFHADPDIESVAVFGYSKKVQLLSRRPGEPWQVETIFEDTDRGHWLEAVELDGRNATRELIGSGYGGRIFLLSRPPGTGLDGVPVDPGRREGKPLVAGVGGEPEMGPSSPIAR